MNLNEMISIDLPSLQSIQLGDNSLEGKKDESCSLLIRSINEMVRNDEYRSSKSNIHRFFTV